MKVLNYLNLWKFGHLLNVFTVHIWQSIHEVHSSTPGTNHALNDGFFGRQFASDSENTQRMRAWFHHLLFTCPIHNRDKSRYHWSQRTPASCNFLKNRVAVRHGDDTWSIGHVVILARNHDDAVTFFSQHLGVGKGDIRALCTVDPSLAIWRETKENRQGYRSENQGRKFRTFRTARDQLAVRNVRFSHPKKERNIPWINLCLEKKRGVEKLFWDVLWKYLSQKEILALVSWDYSSRNTLL